MTQTDPSCLLLRTSQRVWVACNTLAFCLWTPGWILSASIFPVFRVDARLGVDIDRVGAVLIPVEGKLHVIVIQTALLAIPKTGPRRRLRR